MAAAPKYQQIADELRQQIRRGAYKIGDQIPSAPALAERFGTSAMTVTNALKVLRDEGVIIRRHGVPTTVASIPSDQPKPTTAQRLAAVEEGLDVLTEAFDTLNERVARLEQSTPADPSTES